MLENYYIAKHRYESMLNNRGAFYALRLTFTWDTKSIYVVAILIKYIEEIIRSRTFVYFTSHILFSFILQIAHSLVLGNIHLNMNFHELE
jgi:hypothetical protein